MSDLVVIEQGISAGVTYLSEKLGRDFGSPLGGWTAHREEATHFSREKAEHLLAGPLAHVSPNCRLVPV